MSSRLWPVNASERARADDSHLHGGEPQRPQEQARLQLHKRRLPGDPHQTPFAALERRLAQVAENQVAR